MSIQAAAIEEDDLQAYIDNRVSGERLVMIEFYLSQYPKVRTRDDGQTATELPTRELRFDRIRTSSYAAARRQPPSRATDHVAQSALCGIGCRRRFPGRRKRWLDGGRTSVKRIAYRISDARNYSRTRGRVRA